MYRLKNGELMSKYCRINKIPYSPVWERIAIKGMSPDQAIQDYLNKKGKPHVYHWVYEGMTLSQYCKQHNLPYQKIVNYYWRNNKHNKISFKRCTIEEVVEIYKNNENPKPKKHLYHGRSVASVCKELGIDYIQVVNAYHRWNFKNVNKKPCTIEEVVDYFLTNRN